MGCQLEYPVLEPLFLQTSKEAHDFSWGTAEALMDETVRKDEAHKPNDRQSPWWHS
ncbi:MAG: hypothetical protein ACJ8AW_21235 [Rhodopila sp.]